MLRQMHTILTYGPNLSGIKKNDELYYCQSAYDAADAQTAQDTMADRSDLLRMWWIRMEYYSSSSIDHRCISRQLGWLS